jgi:hypothetical protein
MTRSAQTTRRATARQRPRPASHPQPRTKIRRAARPRSQKAKSAIFRWDTKFLLRTVIGGGHVVVRAGPGRRGTCSTRPVTPRAGLGGQDTALGRRLARRQRHGRLPGTARVRPHHSAEPSGYVAACGRQGRRACGLRQRTGPIPQAGKACLSRTAISFSTSDLGRGWSMLKRRAPDEVG